MRQFTSRVERMAYKRAVRRLKRTLLFLGALMFMTVFLIVMNEAHLELERRRAEQRYSGSYLNERIERQYNDVLWRAEHDKLDIPNVIQLVLWNGHFYPKGVNGRYLPTVGPERTAAVKNFQKEYNLTVDGIIGSETKRKILEVYYKNPIAYSKLNLY